MVHMFLAQRMRAPEFMVTENEAQRLSHAINDVAQHYPGLDIDPVVKSWLGLAFCAGSIYAPRFMAFRERLTEMRKKSEVKEEAFHVN